MAVGLTRSGLQTVYCTTKGPFGVYSQVRTGSDFEFRLAVTGETWLDG